MHIYICKAYFITEPSPFYPAQEHISFTTKKEGNPRRSRRNPIPEDPRPRTVPPGPCSCPPPQRTLSLGAATHQTGYRRCPRASSRDTRARTPLGVPGILGTALGRPGGTVGLPGTGRKWRAGDRYDEHAR